MSQIKGKQIKDDTITGADVNEDTLVLKYFTTHRYTLNDSNAKQFVRFNAGGSNNESTNAHNNNRFIAPADGKIKLVAIRSTGQSENPMGSTEIAFHKISDEVAAFGNPSSPSAHITQNISSLNSTVMFDFSNLSSPHDTSFNAGQVLGIRIDPTNNHGNVDLTVVWEFDWSS